jgi:hypothetical protein
MKYKVELKIKIPVVVEVEADNEDLAYQNAKIEVGRDITEHGLTICSGDLEKVKIKRVRFELSKEEA